jgi:threonine aldolase
MNKFIDLRSDTVTRPTPEMRRAMAEAEVGDDVYGEDPTINRLEQRAAEMLGKEAGLFVATGTMGNTVAIKMNTEHGQEVICDARAHILDWELSMTAWFSGCLVRTIETDDGILDWDRIERKIRNFGPHNAPTALIEVENTHNMAGGTVYPLETLRDIYANAQDRGLRVHMDGARIFNASAASGVPVHEYAACAETVMFCLSKGLGAPAGSMVVGKKDAIARGRLFRKRLGGGMRQVGVLGAAGLIALEKMPARLGEDHANAQFLARALGAIPGVRTQPERVRTNILMVDVSGTGLTPQAVSARLKAEGVLMNAAGATILRAVTHYDVTRADCQRAVEAFAGVIERQTTGASAN